jgi:hypothetical protein
LSPSYYRTLMKTQFILPIDLEALRALGYVE